MLWQFPISLTMDCVPSIFPFASLDGVETRGRTKMLPVLQQYQVDQRGHRWTRWKRFLQLQIMGLKPAECLWCSRLSRLASQSPVSMVKTLLHAHTTPCAPLMMLSLVMLPSPPCYSRCHVALSAWATHPLIFKLPEHSGSLACCSPRGHKESDSTEWLNWTESSGISQWFAGMSRCPKWMTK